MKYHCLFFALLFVSIAEAQSVGAAFSISDEVADRPEIVLPDSISSFKSGSYSLSQYQIEGADEVQVLDVQRDKGYYSILQINSPEKTPFESTLALMNESDSMGVEFLDLYNQNYSSERQFGIRLQKRGKGTFKPFVIDFSDGTKKTKVFQTTGDQLSTFYGKLEVAGNFLSVQGKGSGYSFSALELKSDEEIPKLWQISHKQDVLHALSFSYYDGDAWKFPLMISEKGNTLVGSIDDLENARLQVTGTSYFNGNVQLDDANLLLTGRDSRILFEAAKDSHGKSSVTSFLGLDSENGDVLLGNMDTNSVESESVSILVSGETGDVFIGADRSHEKLRAVGNIHAADVILDSSLMLNGEWPDELKELSEMIKSAGDELSLVLLNRLLLDKIAELSLKLNSLEQRMQELER
ncbi:hypothetical protein [Sunxiuqinia dokdonensis]|uniref:Uncharacterized protein n=1 Tax=Sunxiuqinia dokdonensis TaxID=1409788 RepID=A0A0L8VDT3_9BACT|nr:hypothetical protein [Sunxiuqinia dokdonensis]KOH46332.1 hypothetical protein NC99_08690 [Sunxiuqinia dokdonensis]